MRAFWGPRIAHEDAALVRLPQTRKALLCLSCMNARRRRYTAARLPVQNSSCCSNTFFSQNLMLKARTTACGQRYIQKPFQAENHRINPRAKQFDPLRSQGSVPLSARGGRQPVSEFRADNFRFVNGLPVWISSPDAGYDKNPRIRI